MAEMTIKNLSHRMAKIDFAMLATCTVGKQGSGQILGVSPS